VNATRAEAERAPSDRLEQLRRVALGLVALLAVAVTTGASVQILLAVFSPPNAGEKTECRAGVQALLTGVSRARGQAAARGEGEREALAAFRRALEPEWSSAPTIRNACRKQNDRDALAAFRQVELLRYAEEQAVRYEALDLSLLRRRAPALVEALTLPQP